MKKYFYGLFVSFCLTACSTLQPAPSRQDVALQNWVLQGRIAIKTETQGENASFNWQQQGDQYTFRLFGPLGIGAVALQGSPKSVQLVTSDGHVYQANSPELLLQRTMGWHLPISHLLYWIHGVPAPHLAAKTQYDAEHRLLQLQQEGWQISYLAYQSDRARMLPRLIILTRATMSVRIVIDGWHTISRGYEK